jgi:hypothetical protein
MRVAGKLVLIAVLLGAGYYVYQRPEIQELFRQSNREGDPLAFLEDLPEINPRPVAKRSEKPRRLTPVVAAEPAPEAEMEQPEPSPEYTNQVANDQLRKVLMQILAAKKLTKGISLAVTDSAIIVTGEVESSEKRKQILDVIDRGREARRLEDQHLTVKQGG